MPKTLFDYLPLELTTYSLSFNSIKEHGITAEVSKGFKETADDFEYWNSMLEEKAQSDEPGQAKRTFLTNPATRLPEYLTVDRIGKAYVVNQVIAGDFNDPVSRIMKGETTEEEAAILDEIDRQRLLAEPPTGYPDVPSALESRAVRAFVASGQLSIEEALSFDHSATAWQTLESCAIRGFIASGQLSIEQAFNVNREIEGQRALESEAVREIIASGQLSIEQAIRMPFHGTSILESSTVRGFIDRGQLSIEQAINLGYHGWMALESSTVRGFIANGQLSIEDAIRLDSNSLKALENGDLSIIDNTENQPDENDSSMRCNVM